jgi:hypothetical protein
MALAMTQKRALLVYGSYEVRRKIGLSITVSFFIIKICVENVVFL